MDASQRVIEAAEYSSMTTLANVSFPPIADIDRLAPTLRGLLLELFADVEPVGFGGGEFLGDLGSALA